MASEIFTDGLIDRIQLINYGRHSNLVISDLSNHKIVQVTGLPCCGKSLVIDAVMFAFGRQIEDPSALIKLGKQCTEVSITLRNSTSLGSFEREIFGDSIIVRRRIKRPSNGPIGQPRPIAADEDEYAICSSSRLVVYHTETAMKRLLDFFKIDIENPLLAMTKETLWSKLIPNNSTQNGKERYKMFLASIGLSKLGTDEEMERFDYVIKCKGLEVERKFKAMNPGQGIRFHHDTRAIVIDVRASPNDSLAGEEDRALIGISLMLALWQQSDMPFKFVDDLDALFEDTTERERVVALMERVHEYSSAGQLFIVSKKRVFSPPVCRDHQVLIVEIRNGRFVAPTPGTVPTDRHGAAIEA